MTLSRLLDGVAVIKMFQTMYGRMVVTHEVEIQGIRYDSRVATKGDLFVAMSGAVVDGHRFINEAIQNGVAAIVMQDESNAPDALFMHAGVAKIVVADSRKALARIAANFYQHPSKRLTLVGITGTNGKTTTTHLIKSVIEAGETTCGLIGTNEHKIGDETVPATHTTPEAVEVNALLSRMVDRGCSAAVMEVSSHALVLHRTEGLLFRVAGFTNLTQDHLDFHGSMEAYQQAKRMLFEGLEKGACAVTNIDDAAGPSMVATTKGSVLTYGFSSRADVSVSGVESTVSGTRCMVSHGGTSREIRSSLTGTFNVYNILAAYSAGVALELPHEQIARGIQSLKAVRGRFEQIVSPSGWTAIVDYAHTPDALHRCLEAIRELVPVDAKGRIISVFGCGGNRDKTKRAPMGRIASSYSDVTIVTSDNPRGEDPGTIIKEILAGVVPGSTVLTNVNRKAAISQGLAIARPGDVVLIAGKGHETYQIVGETRSHFDDREEVLEFIRTRS